MNNAQLINQTSGDVEYYTPPEIIEAARRALGGVIDLDPASSAAANQRVGATRYFDQEMDGLSMSWGYPIGSLGCRLWLNHPFSRGQNHLWINKLLHEYTTGNVHAACAITYACTSEKWFAPLLAYPQCFLRGRTNYYLPDGTLKKGVTKGSVVTYLGPDVASFAAAFMELGTIKIKYH